MSEASNVPSRVVDEYDQSAGTVIVKPESAAALADLLGEIGSPQCHNFKGTPQQVWRMIARATGPGALPASENIGKVIPMAYFYMHRVTLENRRDGELTEVVRTVIGTKDNIWYACVSNGVAQDMARIISAFGLQVFDPPINVQIVQAKTRAGFNIYRLQPVD